jgi:serpin B
MYVILPKDSAALETFVHGLTPATFDALIASLQSRSGTIQLPRFKTSYDVQLNAALKRLGMGVAFTPAADFSNIHALPPKIAIGDVHHASFLQVDEAGTKAAAVTTVGFRTLAIREEQPPFKMVVDHPFLVAIRDERNDQMLFLGTIDNP